MYCFCLKKDGQTRTDLTKTVFVLPDFMDQRYIHYIWNESITLPIAHGNAKFESKLFFRTPPSTLCKMEEPVIGPKPSNKVYKEVANSNGKDINQVPRNLKQMQNATGCVKQAQRTTHDVIANAHEIAYNSLGFVQNIMTYPDLVVLIGTSHI